MLDKAKLWTKKSGRHGDTEHKEARNIAFNSAVEFLRLRRQGRVHTRGARIVLFPNGLDAVESAIASGVVATDCFGNLCLQGK